jgi:glycosyltransferase involved in cell wall biosynthesis/tetratricopeptide (TPR) repeat protein
LRRANAARASKQWRTAAAEYAHYLTLRPMDFAVWVQRGHAEKESGYLDAAERCYLQALSINAGDADLWLQLGHLYKIKGRHDLALDSYEKCLAFDPRNQDADREILHYRLSGQGLISSETTTGAAQDVLPREEGAAPDAGPPAREDKPSQSAVDGLGALDAQALPASDAALQREVEAIRNSGLFDEAYYRAAYPDMASPEIDVIRHYCEHGWREGRNPSADFDTVYYLEIHDDIHQANINPFWHYVLAGAAERRVAMRGHEAAATEAEIETVRQSGFFDEAFYRAMYPDLEPPPEDPVRHYCTQGWREGRNPSSDFDTASYLSAYSDIRNANINPFWHFIVAGASELRHANPDAATRFEDDIRFGRVDTDVRMIAFWAAPDWSHLRRGRPATRGQSQPLLPHADWGFYDPLDGAMLRRQAEAARRHGLAGFCFPAVQEGGGPSPALAAFLAEKTIDFGFCAEVDLAAWGRADAIVNRLAEAAADDRYLQIQGRPIILVSMAGAASAEAALIRLKERLGDQGLANPFIIGRFDSSEVADRVYQLCDARLDHPTAAVPGETGTFPALHQNGIDIVPYSVVAAQGAARAQRAQRSVLPVFGCVTLGRDNSSTKPERPLVYTRFHIKAYRRWLDSALEATRLAHPQERRLIFINAWNDWNEGLALEPDRQGGFCRLNETTRALMGIPTAEVSPKVSVIVPNYNHERYLRRRLTSIFGQTYQNIEILLMDDASIDRSRDILDEFSSSYPDITRRIYNDLNSGSPFRQWSKGIKAATGDLIWIAESDDYCDHNFLETLVRQFNDESVLLAYSHSAFVDENEDPIVADFRNYLKDLVGAARWDGPYIETAHNEVRTALGIKNTIPNASGVVFRRPVDLPLLQDEAWLSMKAAGDWVFYLHLIRGGKIAYSTETTNYFRRYKGSTAEATYRKETFYREVAMAARTVASLYDVPVETLEKSRRTYLTMYRDEVAGEDAEFERWYDFPSILSARASRHPNVMVSTMGFYPGGAEILPIRLANEYKRQGLSVLLFSSGLNPREDGVRRMVRNDVPLVETSDVEEMRDVIKEFGIEVLNSHQWHIQKYPNELPEVFTALRGHVASLHGMIEHGAAFAVTKEQLKAADESVTTWVYTAEKNLGPFIDLGLYEGGSERFRKIPNGLPMPTIDRVPRAEMGIPEDAFVLCCVSRAIPDKGWAETIQVVERAREMSGVDIRLILVGNGPVYEEYCTAGVPDFVYLAGFSDNSVGHYAAADMGIMLTRFKSESFPLTIVDCLFAGRPYIASDVGDIRNMLTTKDGIAGAVIKLKDWEVQIETAAEIVAAFASDGAEYSRAKVLVADLANSFRIDVVAREYIGIFDGALAHHEKVGEPGANQSNTRAA